MRTSLDIISIGNAFMDILYTRDGTFEKCGGAAASVAIRLRKLGLKTGFIGRIGNDEYGKRILNELVTIGVDTERLRMDHFPTSSILIDAGPEARIRRAVRNYKQIEFVPEDLEYLNKCKAIYIRAGSPFFSRAAVIPSKTLFVSLNPLKEEKINIKELEDATINVLFCNDEEYPAIAECASRLINKGTLIVMTRGKNGAVIYSKSGMKEYPNFAVKSVDVTGAGDAFSAGFIYGYLKKWEMPRIVEFASACGAIAVMHYGPREVVPSEQEITEFIRTKKA